MPERFECEVLQKERYINTLTFTFYRYFTLIRFMRRQCFQMVPLSMTLGDL